MLSKPTLCLILLPRRCCLLDRGRSFLPFLLVYLSRWWLGRRFPLSLSWPLEAVPSRLSDCLFCICTPYCPASCAMSDDCRRLSFLVAFVRRRRRGLSDTCLLSVARQILHNIHSGGSGRLSVWWALVGNDLTASYLAYKPHECPYSCRGSRFLGRLLSACQFLLSFSGWFSVMVVVDSLRQNYHVVVWFLWSSPTAHSFWMCVASYLVVWFLRSSPATRSFWMCVAFCSVVWFLWSSPTTRSFWMCAAFCSVVWFLWSSPTFPMFFVDKSKKKVGIKRV